MSLNIFVGKLFTVYSIWKVLNHSLRTCKKWSGVKISQRSSWLPSRRPQMLSRLILKSVWTNISESGIIKYLLAFSSQFGGLIRIHACYLQFNHLAMRWVAFKQGVFNFLKKNVNIESETWVNYLIDWYSPQKRIPEQVKNDN